MSEIAIFIALVIIAAGALLFGLSTKGEQQSLGGAVMIGGMVIMTAGGLFWMLGQ